MSEPAEFVRAKFEIESGPNQGTFDVHFNPVSLSYSITNQTNSGASGGSSAAGGGSGSGGSSGGSGGGAAPRTQFMTQSTGKLTLDLVFDTTHDGQDVRTFTEKVAKTMEPVSASEAPPIVKFTWGVYSFRGMVEGYKETIDFFAPNGVPLRAAVNLTLSSQDKVFDEGPHDRQADTTGGSLTAEAVRVPAGPDGAAGVANRLGKPSVARAIAAMNGQDSVRFSAGASLSVGARVGGGLRAGISGGLRTGGAISVKAGPASLTGAFSGLRPQVRKETRVDASVLLPKPPTTGLAADANATFAVGGRANIEASASMKADVGANASLGDRIRFGEG